MEYIKLNQVCAITMGQSPNSDSYNEDGEGVPFYQGNADFGEKYPIPRNWCTNPKKYADPEDILISVRAPIGALNYSKEKCCIGRGLAAIKPNIEKVLPEYVYLFLKSKKRELNRKGTGSTFKAISKKVLEEVLIPQLSIENQKDCVDKLLIIEKIIRTKKQELNYLDLLIKARFVEMFGDPILNPKGWDVKPVGTICDYMVPGRDKPKSFTGDIPWITIDDLVVNGVTMESKSKVGLTQDEIKLVKRKTVPVGSVLMSCVGNLGICSVAGKEMVINQQLHSFQCKNVINNVFLMYCLDKRKDYMKKYASSTTVLYMNKSICNSIPIIVPPIELQNQFSYIVKQVDKSKVAIQKSLDETQLLFDSLMQKYFG